MLAALNSGFKLLLKGPYNLTPNSREMLVLEIKIDKGR